MARKAIPQKPILEELLDGFNAANITGQVPKPLTAPKGAKFHRLNAKPHPNVLRAAALAHSCAQATNRLEREHEEMHREMKRKSTERRSKAHQKIHADIELGHMRFKLASLLLTLETHRWHPEVAGHAAAFGPDGSIGWAEPRQQASVGPIAIAIGPQELFDLLASQ